MKNKIDTDELSGLIEKVRSSSRSAPAMRMMVSFIQDNIDLAETFKKSRLFMGDGFISYQVVFEDEDPDVLADKQKVCAAGDDVQLLCAQIGYGLSVKFDIYEFHNIKKFPPIVVDFSYWRNCVRGEATGYYLDKESSSSVLKFDGEEGDYKHIYDAFSELHQRCVNREKFRNSFLL